MKAHRYVLIFFFVFCSFFVVAQVAPDISLRSQTERPIYWLHGLGGSQYSWDRVSTAVQVGVPGFPARKVQGLKPTYGPNSLTSAALDLEVQMKTFDRALDQNNNGLPVSENIIIAHSQGGLVARRLDQLFNSPNDADRRFGGLVTFGTPHGGAYILNSVRNGYHEDFITEACLRITGGGIEEFKSTVVSLFNFDKKIDNVKNIICQDFAMLAVEQFLSQYLTPITNDYYEGAAVLNSLNNYSHPYIQKVAFYSEEMEPVFWRLIFSLINEPNGFPAFEANEDEEVVHDAVLNYLKMYSLDNIWDERGDNNPLGNWFGGKHYFQGKLYDIANKYKDAANWWKNANEKWEYLIGARKYELVYTNNCQCMSRESDGRTPEFVSIYDINPLNCDSYESIRYISNCSPHYSSRFVFTPSDGIVVESSAKAFPEAVRVKLIGSNHQQMRNDRNTKQALSDLFNGEHGEYFITVER